MEHRRLGMLAARVAAGLLGAHVVASCIGSTSESPVRTGLRPVSGMGITAPAGTALPDPLVVQAEDSFGVPLADVAVTFSIREIEGRPRGGGVRTDEFGARFRSSVVVMTNAAGLAQVLVQLDTAAGPTHVDLSANDPSLHGTAEFTSVAGAPARILLEPWDTAVVVGGSMSVRGRVIDVYGNARADRVTFSTSGPGTVTASGVVQGTASGRMQVHASLPGIQATSFVSVVPSGFLAAVAQSAATGTPLALVTFRSDGSDMKVVAHLSTSDPSERTPSPTWSPAGDRLAYVLGRSLFVVDMAGTSTALVTSVPGGDLYGDPWLGVDARFGLQYSADGRWIYFTAISRNYQRAAWRVATSGGAMSEISPNETWGLRAMPTPEPTGSRVIYQASDGGDYPGDFTLRARSLDDGGDASLGVLGESPRWSPTGDLVAYLDGERRQLRVMHPDGSNRRVVGEVKALPGFSWSRDGAWLAIDRPQGFSPWSEGLSLVNVTTGDDLPLRFRGPGGQVLTQPAWRP